jgi:hypothetical protein
MIAFMIYEINRLQSTTCKAIQQGPPTPSKGKAPLPE